MSHLFNFKNSVLPNFDRSNLNQGKMNQEILVIGSSGKTGSRVFNRLQSKNIAVRPASRSSAIPFDWYNDKTWAKALEGIAKVYITFQPDLAVPASSEIIFRFTQEAQRAGIEKLVLLSGRGEEEAIAAENVIRNCGMQWTIIQASFFMQNFSEGIWADSIQARELVLPEVKAKEPFVDADDIADIAIEALMNDNLNGKVCEVTGPELLSFQEVVSKLSKGLNTEIKFIPVSMEAYKNILKEYLVPDDVTELITYLFTSVLDGRNESVTNDIEQALNRKPTTFDAYIQKSINAGFWQEQ